MKVPEYLRENPGTLFKPSGVHDDEEHLYKGLFAVFHCLALIDSMFKVRWFLLMLVIVIVSGFTVIAEPVWIKAVKQGEEKYKAKVERLRAEFPRQIMPRVLQVCVCVCMIEVLSAHRQSIVISYMMLYIPPETPEEIEQHRDYCRKNGVCCDCGLLLLWCDGVFVCRLVATARRRDGDRARERGDGRCGCCTREG